MNPILCGTREEYQHLMNRMGLSNLYVGTILYPYIDNSQRLMGLSRHTTVFRCGSWEQRCDLPELMEVMFYREFKFIDLGEGDNYV